MHFFGVYTHCPDFHSVWVAIYTKKNFAAQSAQKISAAQEIEEQILKDMLIVYDICEWLQIDPNL